MEPTYNSTMKKFESDVKLETNKIKIIIEYYFFFKKVKKLDEVTGKLLNDSLEEKDRINSFKNQSNFAWTKARATNNIATSLVTQVTNWNKTAHGV